MRVLLTVLSLYLVQYIAHVHGGASVCHKDNWDWTACRQGIIDIANNKEMFYFGKQSDHCKDAPPMDIDCNNYHETYNHSIASILEIDPNNIDRYLNVTFTSKAGWYESCDNKYGSDKSTQIVLDPLSDTRQEPWSMREMPEFTWEADPNTLYTLMIKDVGAGFIHGIFMNIQGNDTSTADVIKEYHGPRNSRNVTNPYAIMLFSQNGVTPIQLNASWWATVVNPMAPFNVSQFQTDLQLQGPVAMNWIAASYDPYALSKSQEWIENCASFVQQALSTHEITFLPEVPKLSVYMRVMFNNHYIEYEYCCQHHWYREDVFWLNPIGNGSFTPEETRTGNPVQLFVNMNKLFPIPAVDFQGKMYTMLAVDPSLPLYKYNYGTRQYPLVHWMALNGWVGPLGMLHFDTEILAWKGPMPPDQAPHTYYFLLMEQEYTLPQTQLSDMANYSGEACREQAGGKCLFDVASFASDNNLKLVGASWMNANNTDYVNMTNKLEQTEEVCGARYPCPTDPWVNGANVVSQITTFVMVILNIMAVVLIQ